MKFKRGLILIILGSMLQLLGMYAVFGLIVWVFLYLKYMLNKNIEWYYKVLVPILSYLSAIVLFYLL